MAATTWAGISPAGNWRRTRISRSACGCDRCSGARGFQVVTTRESDQSVDLNRRAEIANHAEARACISLHTADTGSGVHLFVSSLTPAAPARFVAWKTAQAGWVTRSLALAGVLNAALLHAGTTVTLGRTPLPGIESMTCPAVAVEIGSAARFRPQGHRGAGRSRVPGAHGADACRPRCWSGGRRRRPDATRPNGGGGTAAVIPRYQIVIFSVLRPGLIGHGGHAVAPAADARTSDWWRGWTRLPPRRRKWPRRRRPR